MVKKTLALSCLTACIAVAGCGGGGGADKPAPPAPSAGKDSPPAGSAPVTLTMYGDLAPDYIEQYITSHIRKKLPHITLEYIRNEKGRAPSDIVSAGTIPDLINLPTDKLYAYQELGLLSDLTPLIKKTGFDLTKLADGLIDSIKAYSPNGDILTMPWGTGNYALYYNKDIFDRFGVPYPKDGMTWDQVYDLAVKLTRQEGGVQYRGFDFAPAYVIGFNQLSLPLVDPKTEKAAVTTDAWSKYFDNFARFSRIPGNEFDPKAPLNDEFAKTKRVAMAVSATMFPLMKEAETKGSPVNFDIVSIPVFPEAPRTSLQFVASSFGIPQNSKHKDEAMQVIQLLMSDDVQKQGAEIVRLPALKSDELRKATGKSDPALASKNLQALYMNNMALTKVSTKYDGIARTDLVAKFNEYRAGTKDVNTTLREAAESIDKKIAQEKSK